MTILSDTLITVIDLETVPPSLKSVNDFIASEDEKNRLQYITGDIPKSLVVTDERTYVSPLSTSILKKRAVNGMEDIL